MFLIFFSNWHESFTVSRLDQRDLNEGSKFLKKIFLLDQFLVKKVKLFLSDGFILACNSNL